MVIWARVKTEEQFWSVVESNVLFADCIIVDFSLALNKKVLQTIARIREERNAAKPNQNAFDGKRKFYYQLPDVLRNPKVEKLLAPVKSFDGVVIKNLDELGVIASADIPEVFELVGDAFLYAYNKPALELYRSFVPNMKFILSDELKKEELSQLMREEPAESFILKVYGHQAVMITAQCLNKNYGRCWKQKTSGKGREQRTTVNKRQNPVIRFTDETGEDFYSASHCAECYSVIYKGEPTCILSKAEDKPENRLFDFTIESENETAQILKDWKGLAYNGGHFNKGIE